MFKAEGISRPHHSLPIGLSDTGRMLTAVSDSYLPNLVDDFGLEESTGKKLLSPEESALVPPLTMQDRHPSAPQLASMLASSVDNHKLNSSSDNSAGVDEMVWRGMEGRKEREGEGGREGGSFC